MTDAPVAGRRNMAVVKTLTYLMFAMFAMTTDSVGLIIPEVIRTFQLSLTAAGTFQYATMAGIAFAGLFLGYTVYRWLWRAMWILIPTLLLGRVFCGWICPLGAIFDAYGWVLRRLRVVDHLTTSSQPSLPTPNNLQAIPLVCGGSPKPFLGEDASFLHGITFGGHPVSCAVVAPLTLLVTPGPAVRTASPFQ